MKYVKAKIWQRIRICACIVGLFTAIYCLAEGVPNYSSELWLYWLIPLSYSIYHFCAGKIFMRQHGLALGIIEVIMFFRYIVAPIITCSFTDQSQLFVFVNSADNLGMATALMLYEMWAIYFTLHFVIPRVMGIKVGYIERGKLTSDDFRKNKGDIIQYAIIIFWFYIITVSPECRSYLFRITNINVASVKIEDYQSGINGTYLVFYYIGIVVLYAKLINIIQKQRFLFKWAPIRFIMIVILSVLFVSSTWSNGESASRWALMVGTVVMMYILIQNFPNSQKVIFVLGIICLITLLLVGSFAKTFVQGKNLSFNESIENYISVKYINEYFSGIFPVANGISIAKRIEGNLFYILLYDIFANVPLFLSNLNLNAASSLVQFRDITSRGDLIMPTISSGYAIFTILGAPLYSMLLCVLAFMAEKKLRTSHNALIQVFGIYLVYWCSLFMALNINVIQSMCWQYFIGLILVSIGESIARKIRLKN